MVRLPTAGTGWQFGSPLQPSSSRIFHFTASTGQLFPPERVGITESAHLTPPSSFLRNFLTHAAHPLTNPCAMAPVCRSGSSLPISPPAFVLHASTYTPSSHTHAQTVEKAGLDCLSELRHSCQICSLVSHASRFPSTSRLLVPHKKMDVPTHLGVESSTWGSYTHNSLHLPL
jgi:hypothetical protein